MTPSEFVERLLNHFGKPQQATNLKALRADFEDAIRATAPDVLKDASDRLIRTHGFQNWPTIADCLAAVDAAAVAKMVRVRQQARGYEPTPGWTPPTPESRARVQALVDEVKAKLTGRARA